ncbi:MAG: hypothetical protein U9R02_14860, partial [Thermodesulfobacteriota bacterium]|nr:hypothetical protein [Thermodesulfobacteriota bacterium]
MKNYWNYRKGGNSLRLHNFNTKGTSGIFKITRRAVSCFILLLFLSALIHTTSSFAGQEEFS